MKLIDRIRNHPAVEVLSEEPGDYGMSYFVYLNKGWEWSEQRGFGCETLTETWRLVRASKQVDTPPIP